MSSLNGRKRRSKIDAPRAVLRIRLVGAKEGHIPLADLGGLAGGIQETILRIARSRAERSGPGRTPDDLRAWITLEATGIERGSAVLVVEAPGLAQEQLPLGLNDPGLEALSDLDDALEAVSRGEALPSEFDRLSEQSLRTMLRRLSSYERVEWSHYNGEISRTIEVIPGTADVTAETPSERDGSQESLVGRLYQLNLKSHGYGIEDDLGRSIHCEFPRDEDHLKEIRELVGRRIVLTGTAYRDEEGDIQRFEVEEIRAADGAAPIEEFFSFDLEATLSAVRPIDDPSSLKIDNLTETEDELFWQALNE